MDGGAFLERQARGASTVQEPKVIVGTEGSMDFRVHQDFRANQASSGLLVLQETWGTLETVVYQG